MARAREIFSRKGYEPLPPSEVDPRQLPGRLWELIYAAASCRFFFFQTDHLSDRELYNLLWEEWLDEATADIPPEAETNTHVLISEFNVRGLNSHDIWMRYYADEQDKELCLTEGDCDQPPHEDPPYDRDRFLPTATVPIEAHSGWLPGDDEIVSEEGEAAFDGISTEFENELAKMEPENWTPTEQELKKQNIPLLPPSEITEETLTPILWELLHNLALFGFYVLHTDHLSDLELYTELWQHGLRDPAHLPGRNPRGGWFHDILGSWGDEEMQVWLRLYASDQERAKHHADYPNDPMPPKEKLPFNRDWRLPKGPF